jgi:hypothetical protein
MGIKERINKIATYFKEMQIVTLNDGKQVIYVIVAFPNGWVIDEDIENKFDVTVQRGEYVGEYFFCGEIDNGEGVVFDAIEYNIEKMKEAIERAQLLSEKTLELRRMFEDESISIERLRTLKISYDEKSEIIVPKKIDKENKEQKENKHE